MGPHYEFFDDLIITIQFPFLITFNDSLMYQQIDDGFSRFFGMLMVEERKKALERKFRPRVECVKFSDASACQKVGKFVKNKMIL